MSVNDEVKFIEKELKVGLPDSYRDFLVKKGNDIAFGLPILGLPATNDLSSVLGATFLLRMSRPELQNYLAIRIYKDRMLCLDTSSGDLKDAPLVEVELCTTNAPKMVHNSFSDYLKNSDLSKKEIKNSLERLKIIIERNKAKNKNYSHTDNKVPFKARDWRIHRCCVHDLVVGLTAFRYNEAFNGIEVDTFLSTEHPDYEAAHGTKALIALILSDAYKNGTSMEVRFREKRIPQNLRQLIDSFNVKLTNSNQGIIGHNESISIFSSLLGIQNETKNRIQELEKSNEATLQGICFLINSRVWTIEQINWLILNAQRVKAIVFGRDNPEIRINYAESLSLGRCALAMTKLKEKIQISSEDEINETEITANSPQFTICSFKPCSIDWLNNNESFIMLPGEIFRVLSRPRSKWNNILLQIQEDIKLLENEKHKKIILYGANILDYPDFHSIFSSVNKIPDLFYAIVPFSSDELDEEVITKMKKARLYRV